MAAGYRYIMKCLLEAELSKDHQSTEGTRTLVAALRAVSSLPLITGVGSVRMAHAVPDLKRIETR